MVTWLVLRRVETGEISYEQMGSSISWPCSQRGGGGGYRATGIAICVQVAREGIWRPRSSHKRKMGCLLWLMSCWLLGLNSRAQEKHLTSQLSWVTAWLLVIRVFPVYLVEERCYFGMIYFFVGKVVIWERWEKSEVPRPERWEGSEVTIWEMGEGSEMARWEVLGFIQGWGTQGETKILSFCFWC